MVQRLTRRLFSGFLAFVDALHMLPVQLDLHDTPAKFRVVTGRWHAAVYTAQALNFGLFICVYAMGVTVLVLAGRLDPGPTDKALYVGFTICGAGGLALQVGIRRRRAAMVHFLNSSWTLLKTLTRRYRQGGAGASRPDTSFVLFRHWEPLFQASLLFGTHSIPVGLLAFYLAKPFKKLFPVWILQDTLNLNLNGYGYVSVYVYAFPVLMQMYVMALHQILLVFFTILVAYQFLFWSNAITNTNKGRQRQRRAATEHPQNSGSAPPGNVHDAILIHSCLQICMQHLHSGVRHFYFPFAVFLFYAGGILANCTCVLRHGTLPVYVTLFFAEATLVVVFLLLATLPAIGRIQTNSRTFVRVWSVEVKRGGCVDTVAGVRVNVGRYSLRRLRACMPL